MEFIPAVAMVALIAKVIDFSRYARAKDINGVVTQLYTWAAGVIAIVMAAHTNWATGINIGDTPLNELSIWSQIFAGLSIASTASIFKDSLKAVDNHNSAVIPTLVQPRRRKVTASKEVG